MKQQENNKSMQNLSEDGLKMKLWWNMPRLATASPIAHSIVFTLAFLR